MRPPPRTMVALITPFVENGSIDGPAHRHNLARLAEWEVGGFLIGGSTGQGPYLEAGERAVLTALARDELGQDAFLLTGVSAQSVRQALEQIGEGADAGADAVAVISGVMDDPTPAIAAREYSLLFNRKKDFPRGKVLTIAGSDSGGGAGDRAGGPARVPVRPGAGHDVRCLRTQVERGYQGDRRRSGGRANQAGAAGPAAPA